MLKDHIILKFKRKTLNVNLIIITKDKTTINITIASTIKQLILSTLIKQQIVISNNAVKELLRIIKRQIVTKKPKIKRKILKENSINYFLILIKD